MKTLSASAEVYPWHYLFTRTSRLQGTFDPWQPLRAIIPNWLANKLFG